MTTRTPSQSAPPTPRLRSARPDDLPAVERLLEESHLPTAGVATLFATAAGDFVVADDPERSGELAAVGGLEVCCDDALLRSVAVRPEWRARGLGRALVERLVGEGESRSLRALYLLTTTAERYFPRFGFAQVERSSVPAEVRGSVEFRDACPASAVVMARSLGDARAAATP